MRIGEYKSASKGRNQCGFTLIEMCICLLIMGFLMVPIAQSYMNSQTMAKREKARENVKESASEITSILSIGRLPCPSNRALAPGNINFGREMGLAEGVEPTLADITALPLCTGGMQGICRTNGARDTDIDADTTVDPIIIGGVPFQSIRDFGGTLTAEKAMDAWGNRLTYAVSARLCQAPVDPTNRINAHKRGVIRALDEFGNPTAGIGARDLSEPPDGTLDSDGQLVVLSHGETGAGAYSDNGTPVANCDTTTRDGENCDNDFTFVSSLGSYKADNANFFDDLTYFQLYIPNDLWENVSMLVGGASESTPDIRNLNDNNIGVLTNTPEERLHVNGSAQAATTRSSIFCNRDGDNCFDYDFLLTTRTAAGAKRNTCNAGQVITSIGNNTVTCGNPTLQAPGAEMRCPVATPYLRGILSDGTPICTN